MYLRYRLWPLVLLAVATATFGLSVCALLSVVPADESHHPAEERDSNQATARYMVQLKDVAYKAFQSSDKFRSKFGLQPIRHIDRNNIVVVEMTEEQRITMEKNEEVSVVELDKKRYLDWGKEHKIRMPRTKMQRDYESILEQLGLGRHSKSLRKDTKQANDNISASHLRERQYTPYGIDMVLDGFVDPEDPSSSNPSTMLCIIDTGYDLGHPDLPTSHVQGSDQPYEWSFDDCSHGTHVAGITSALNNDEGVVGVLRKGLGKIVLYIVNVFGTSCESTSVSAIIEGVDQCLGAASRLDLNLVISVSIGSLEYSALEDTAFQRAADEGALAFAAAGNAGTFLESYPASYASVMSVAAVDMYKVNTMYSQYNDAVDIAAPGHGVLSTYPRAASSNGYAYLDGTSMACPHASASAALVWSFYPSLSRQELREALQSSAEDLGAPGMDENFGFGLVNVPSALKLLGYSPLPIRTPSPTPDASASPMQYDLSLCSYLDNSCSLSPTCYLEQTGACFSDYVLFTGYYLKPSCLEDQITVRFDVYTDADCLEYLFYEDYLADDCITGVKLLCAREQVTSTPTRSPSWTPSPTPVVSKLPSKTPIVSPTHSPTHSPSKPSSPPLSQTPSTTPYLSASPTASQPQLSLSSTPIVSTSASETPVVTESLGVEATSSLSPFGSETATLVPVIISASASVSPANTASDSVCFPYNAEVELDDGRLITMEYLQIGDRIRAGITQDDEQFSEIYFFGHRIPPTSRGGRLYEFVRITLSNNQSITLSPSHWIHTTPRYLANVNVAWSFAKGKPAKEIKHGDLLFAMQENVWSLQRVVSMSTVYERGLYNPHTLQGNLVVSGILASSYTDILRPSLAHALLTVPRWVHLLTHKVELSLGDSFMAFIGGQGMWSGFAPQSLVRLGQWLSAL